jgi:type IV secretion system protein VirB9
MKGVVAAVLLSAALLGSPALALEAPQAMTSDPNMRRQEYNPNGRTLIITSLQRSTAITFCPGESILRVVFGDDGVVEGPDPKELANRPLGGELPLWPKKVGRTNMQVITVNPGKPDKIYQFALEVRDGLPGGADDPQATYGLTFTCKAEERRAEAETARARRLAARAETQDKARLAAAKRQLLQGGLEGPRNWRYVARGTRAIAPLEISDNGAVTVFRFAGNMQVPAIYAVGVDGSEQIVPFSMQDDRMVVQRTARAFRLRLGRAVLDVYNLGYDPVGTNPGTGTTSPAVLREVRHGSAS